MGTEKLEESVKTRVERPIKRGFEKLAKLRHADVSDLAREAFREYLARHPEAFESEPVAK